MESASDQRFDPNYAAQLLIDIAHEQSLDSLLQKLINRILTRPGMVCVQIWLIDKGDICATCRRKNVCADTSRCLHLVAGDGIPVSEPAEVPHHFGDKSERMPLNHGLLGKSAATGQQVMCRNMDLQTMMESGFDWMEREHILALGATPIVFKGETLGIIVGFSRENPPEESRPWGRIFADHIGAAIANARAFEEIQALKAQLEQQNSYLQEEFVEARAFGTLVGQSSALRQIICQIDLVAPTEASVLILGETGTGKELVAHEIHNRSPRKDKPMIRVNCASIPKDLFESELFGHVKGAFTGAIKDRVGRFETAEGGTILLDEIGEVPLDMQSKLLRVLQDKRYERVGDDRTRHANVRIIGATNRDLKKAVAAARFREDLYYRLHVFPIHVAPLRERKDDIPLLASHFIELSAKELRCPKPRLTRAAITALQTYDWPGNIRELRNVIERAVILSRGGLLRFDLPASNTTPTAVKIQPQSVSGKGFLTEAEFRQKERENLKAVLEKSQWKIKGENGAAELLGIKPTTLLSRMDKMGLKRPDLSASESKS